MLEGLNYEYDYMNNTLFCSMCTFKKKVYSKNPVSSIPLLEDVYTYTDIAIKLTIIIR